MVDQLDDAQIAHSIADNKARSRQIVYIYYFHRGGSSGLDAESVNWESDGGHTFEGLMNVINRMWLEFTFEYEKSGETRGVACAFARFAVRLLGM